MIITKLNLKKIINRSLKESRFFLSSPYQKIKDENKIELCRKWISVFNFYLNEGKKRNKEIDKSSVGLKRKKIDENRLIFIKDQEKYGFDIRSFELYNLNDEFENALFLDNINYELIEKLNVPESQINNLLLERNSEIIKEVELPISLDIIINSVAIDKLNKMLKNEAITTIYNFDELKYILQICELVNSNVTLTASRMSSHFGNPDQSLDDPDFINASTNSDMSKFIMDIASPSTFISFVDPYEFNLEYDENSSVNDEYLPPKFSLNPAAAFGTPHGVYGYPLDKINAKRFIETGSPTDAKFATNREYFHLIKVDLNNPAVVVFEKDGTTKNLNLPLFKKEYFIKVKELYRIYTEFYRDDSKDIQYSNMTPEEKEIYNINLDNDLRNTYREFIDFIKFGKFSREYALLKNNPFYLLYRFSGFLSRKQGTDVFGDEAKDKNIKMNKGHSEFFALLLHSVGIDCVVDRGLGIVHQNEPAQMHILTFNSNKYSNIYKYLGTYKNFMSTGE